MGFGTTLAGWLRLGDGPCLTRQDATLWAAATSLADLGELNARYLLGDIESRPGVYGRERSADGAPGVIDALVACNRAGFVTGHHMYGWESGDGDVWLNAVTGYADDATLTWLLDLRHPFEVRYWTAASRWQRIAATDRLPVTWWDGQAGTYFGRHPAAAVQDHFDGAGADAVAAAVEAWQVTVYDPQPDRNTLWPALRAAASRHELNRRESRP